MRLNFVYVSTDEKKSDRLKVPTLFVFCPPSLVYTYVTRLHYTYLILLSTSILLHFCSIFIYEFLVLKSSIVS